MPHGELANSIKRHVIQRVKQSEARLDAFPHFTIDDFLPEAVFARLQSDLPPFDDLLLMSQAGMSSVRQYDRRAMLPFAEVAGRRYPETWTAIAQALDSDELEITLTQAFAPWITPEMAEQLKRPVRREVRVHCDRAGSYLLPHTDAPSMFIVSFCYVHSAQDNHPTLDTVLYEPIDPVRRLEQLQGREYAHEDLELHRPIGRIKFRPNRLFTFLRTSTSFHGLEATDETAAPRYLISLHLKYAK